MQTQSSQAMHTAKGCATLDELRLCYACVQSRQMHTAQWAHLQTLGQAATVLFVCGDLCLADALPGDLTRLPNLTMASHQMQHLNSV